VQPASTYARIFSATADGGPQASQLSMYSRVIAGL